jgi:YaiO family outer membrane protein
MIVYFRSFIAGVALLGLVCVPLSACAGEVDLTGSLSSFTSSTGIGPWRNLTLTDRETFTDDTPALALVDQADSDLIAPTHSLGAVLDDYHTWSPRFFTYVAVGAASGSALPTHNAYLEGDMKFGPALATVIGAGAGTVVNSDGTVQNYFNVGPTWYHNNMNVTLRWLPSFTSGRSGASSGLLTLANGAVGTTVTTLTLLGGSQPPYGVVSFTTTSGTGQRALFAGIDVKHWVNPEGGFHIGIELERLNDNATGNLLTVRRALNVGVFHEVGRGPAP